MKATKILAAIALAGATVAPAFAADISHAPETLTFDAGSAFFGGLFTGNNSGNTFTDVYNFSLATPGALTADLLSVSGNAKNGLDITGYSLYSSTGTLVTGGNQLSTGLTDQWSINSGSLAAGNYQLRVTGSVLSQAAGKYYGSVTMAQAVPEPQTYAMLLAGLGLMGVAARRRRG
ncbi:MAG: FxDxF family PEP-CTERM protein [Telluria sp.]